MDTPLLDILEQYRAQGRQRWHTPGHKGIVPPRGGFLDWSCDITEIDDLMASPSPVEESQALMAAALGADHTWYSVAGATLPVMAGILSAFPRGSTLVVDRAAHRSVLGALVIGDYQVRWAYPEVLRAGLPLPLTELPEEWLGSSAGVVLTRPTYDGLAAPAAPLVEAVHRHNRPIVVDEAHGSHWLGSNYPGSALSVGADLVAHGVHKSEAALTQTGLLHLKGTRVDPDAIERWWRILGTSSPSYLLLGSLDRLQWQRRQAANARAWRQLAQDMAGVWETLQRQGIAVLQVWAKNRGLEVDPARLTLLGDGPQIKNQLAAVGTVEKVTAHSCTLFMAPGQPLQEIVSAVANGVPADDGRWLKTAAYPRLAAALSVREAFGRAGRWVPLAEAEGHVLGDALTPYPPGIPLGVPGEVVSAELADWLVQAIQLGAGIVHGVARKGGDWSVWVIE